MVRTALMRWRRRHTTWTSDDDVTTSEGRRMIYSKTEQRALVSGYLGGREFENARLRNVLSIFTMANAPLRPQEVSGERLAPIA